MSTEPYVFEPFDLPDFEVPQKEHWPMAISWEKAMSLLEGCRGDTLSEDHSPEARLRNKNPEPFRMD